MEIAQVLEQHDVRSARRYFRAHGRPDLSGLPGDRGLPVLADLGAAKHLARALKKKVGAAVNSAWSGLIASSLCGLPPLALGYNVAELP